MFELYFEPSAIDHYFEKLDMPTIFLVFEKDVIVEDKLLAAVLS